MVAFLELYGLLSGSNQHYVWERLKHIIYEGDVVTLGGFLKYNMDSQQFDISDIDVIWSGGKENLIEFFKSTKFTYKTIFKIGLVITGIWAAFSIYHFIKHRKIKQDEKKRLEFQQYRNQQPENIPDDETCIVCMECRRDVILLPWNHLILCRFCFPEIRDKCPHCSNNITDHVLMNFQQ